MPEDLPVKQRIVFITKDKSFENKDLYCDADVPRKRKRRRLPGVRKKHTLRHIAMLATVFFAAAVCIRLWDYPQSVPADEAAVPHTPFTGRTLYTLEYSVNETVPEQIENEAVSEQPAAKETYETELLPPQDTAQEIFVDSTSNTSFVDGTTYYPITSKDLSAKSVFAISNETSYEPDMTALAEKTPSALEDTVVSSEPLVLIVHTHAGECYSDYTDMYPMDAPTRSTDTDENVVRVGREIADVLLDFGIPSIHCETQHDKESFINAYSLSASSVSEYLAEYPSIKFVIDVHRDAIIRDDGESIKAVKNIAGQDYAQLMFVVGTNELGHNHPSWQENLSLAVNLQETIESTYPGLCRSINLRDVPFNQQLSEGYLLLEVGTCANTLDEALLSSRAFAENLARLILKNA